MISCVYVSRRKHFSLQYARVACWYGFLFAVEIMLCALGARSPGFHVRRKVEVKLDERQRLDIIEPVTGPTPWVSPLVVVPKRNGEVRTCVDMRRVSTAVIRERYPIPTAEEILQDLTGAYVFSKLDLRWGYHQIELDEQSRHYTTFATHTGLYRYKRLMFCVSAAPEIYQHVMQQLMSPRVPWDAKHLR